MVEKNEKFKIVQSKKDKLKKERPKVALKQNEMKKQNIVKKISLKRVTENKKLMITFGVLLISSIYCIYKVIALIQNPTDTFSVEQGKIYQEEETVRIHY